MAKIFRFSGYLVSNDSYSLQSQIDGIKDFAEMDEIAPNRGHNIHRQSKKEGIEI